MPIFASGLGSRGILSAATDAHFRVGVVRLALGAAPWQDLPGDQSDELLRHAIRERCAPLAWLMSSRHILALAPASAAAKWRAHALGAGELAASQADELAELVAGLAAAGITAVVIKGHPLAVLLYSEPWARPSFDVDLFIPIGKRPAAHRALIELGWQHLDGMPPQESTYRRAGAARAAHLEVHSSLLDDALLSHLQLPEPERAIVGVGGHAIPAHVGDSLPIFLATHLAKHGSVPLLWWIDFTTLWSTLENASRNRVRSLADFHRLAGVLKWAESGAQLIEVIRSGTRDAPFAALKALDAMHSRRNAFRLAAMVDGFAPKLRVAVGWLVPPSSRSSPAEVMTTSLRRLRAILTKRGGSGGSPAAVDASVAYRTVELHPGETAEILRVVTSAGGAAWIKVRGTSMLPAIPRVAEVLVGPIPVDGLHRGDVILVERPGSRLLMHRVVDVSPATIYLKGDNLFPQDAPVLLDQVVGRAIQLRVDGRSVPIPPTPSRSARFAIARLHTHLRRRFGHA